ncbi:hypothetical protein BDV97DRAFT_399598 [Delphinella strobiligena]|nr:hypothetical protein BDV97DRAFT_399598 [Delphinella strobiligena]
MTQPPPQNPTQEAIKLPKIIFYDVQHALSPPFTPRSSWSPFTTRTALALVYRNIPYTRVPISYPDVVGLLSSKGVPPALDDEGRVDDVPFPLPAVDLIYTDCHPSISHASDEKENADTALATETVTIMDSTRISHTLESLLPPSEAHPSLFPLPKTHSQVQKIKAALAAPGLRLRKQIIPFIPFILDARGEEYFVRTRSAHFGKGLEEVRIEAVEEAEGEGGLEGVFCDALRGIARVYLEEAGGAKGAGEGETAEEGEGGEEGPFLGGSKVPSYADFVFVAAVQWWRCARGLRLWRGRLRGARGVF